MKKIIMPLNPDSEGLCRTIRACYGRCGNISFFLAMGQGITGIAEVYEDDISERAGRRSSASGMRPLLKGGMAQYIDKENQPRGGG